MYHIKNHKKSIKSADLISNAFLNLLETKSYEEISVNDLHKESYVSRTTFYSLFDNVDDIFRYQIDQILGEIAETMKTIDDKDLLEYLVYKCISKYIVLKMLLKLISILSFMSVLIYTKENCF